MFWKLFVIMVVIYATFMLDIISVQFPFLRHRLPKVNEKIILNLVIVF
jgi:hypothetical protein